MELKRIVANDSNTALRNVREECGEDALIVSTNKIGRKTEVIYAVDPDPNQCDMVQRAPVKDETGLTSNNFRSAVRNEIQQERLSSLPETGLEARSLAGKLGIRP